MKSCGNAVQGEGSWPASGMENQGVTLRCRSLNNQGVSRENSGHDCSIKTGGPKGREGSPTSGKSSFGKTDEKKS